MKFISSILFFLFFTVNFLCSQERVPPPPPCHGNFNIGAGGVIGNILMTKEYTGESIFINFSQNTGNNPEFNDVFVIYLATGAPGRNVIDQTVDDADDPYRIAITNSNTYGFGSKITFPEAFEASYAIAIDTNSGGLYSIPSSGDVGNGGLNYLTSVNSTLSSNTQQSFTINFTTSDIGITIEDRFYFVGLYVGHDGYNYDEGYGDGILAGTEGADDVTYTGYRSIDAVYPNCTNFTLNNNKNNYNNIDATYVNNKLHISGVNEEVVVKLIDLMGRVVLNIRHQINGNAEIPIELLKNQLQFIVIETSNKKKVLKVIPNTH